MFILNGKKISIDNPIEVNGIRYPDLRDPEIRAALGVTEGPDQVRPQPEDHYFITTDENGMEVYTPKPAEMVKDQENAKIKAQIAALEVASIDLGFFRFLREYCIADVIARAAAQNITLAQLIDPNDPNYAPGFAKVYAHNEELAQLRQGIQK